MGGGNALKCKWAAAMHLCQCGIHQAQLSPRKRGGGNSKDGFFNHVRTAGYVKQFQTNPSKRDIELTRPTEEKFCERDLGGRLLTPSKNEADDGGWRREAGNGKTPKMSCGCATSGGVEFHFRCESAYAQLAPPSRLHHRQSMLNFTTAQEAAMLQWAAAVILLNQLRRHRARRRR